MKKKYESVKGMKEFLGHMKKLRGQFLLHQHSGIVYSFFANGRADLLKRLNF